VVVIADSSASSDADEADDQGVVEHAACDVIASFPRSQM
jgi:hypothetical protein